METGRGPLNESRRARRLKAACAALLLFPALGGWPLGAALDRRSALELDGTHNHGKWHCAAKTFTASVKADMSREALQAAVERADAGGDADPANRALWPSLAPDVRLRIPVKEFDCGNPKMEHDLRRSLKAKDFPVIVFELTRIRSAHVLHPGSYAISVQGVLRLAGVERSVEIHMIADRQAPDRYRFTAVLPVKMTDFEINPPVALFGLIRAADELRINFDILFTLE